METALIPAGRHCGAVLREVVAHYFKAFVAADNHSIGASILNDDQGPRHSLRRWPMPKVYFLAIWKAAVLAVILGSLIQVLIPRDRLLRLFGRVRVWVDPARRVCFALPV